MSPRGAYLSLGIPGTGLSYRTKINSPVAGNILKIAGVRACFILIAAASVLFLGYMVAAGWENTPARTNRSTSYQSANVQVKSAAEDSETVDASIRSVYIARPVVNVRSSASASASIVQKAAVGDKFRVFGEQDGWLMVGVVDPIGWVRADLVNMESRSEELLPRRTSSFEVEP